MVEDSVAHVERVVILLELLVGVERLALTERPLAFAATLGGAGGRHSAISFVEQPAGTAQITGGCPGGADPGAS